MNGWSYVTTNTANVGTVWNVHVTWGFNAPPLPPPRPVRGMSLPEAMMVLGIDSCADEDAIRRAYRKRAREAHPDLGGSEDAMKRLNEAMHVIRRRGPTA